MLKALLPLMDDERKERIRKFNELWPGGDIRVKGNQWLRSAYHKSAVKKVPRENTIRKILYIIVKKKSLRFGLSTLVH